MSSSSIKNMADPTIQTFCCHRPNTSDSPANVMMEFNSDSYNITCIVSSVIGILGAVYQILPRRDKSVMQRWYSFSAVRGRQIVVWLATADLLAAAGVFIRSVLWMRYKNLVPAVSNEATSIIFCSVSSAWVQFFYTATWFWTLCYALDVRFMLKDQEGKTACYHIVSWLFPAVLTAAGLVILYVPDANCHSLNSVSGALARVLPNYCATFIPMATIMIANPILYIRSTKDVKTNISRSLCQFTQKERTTVDAIKLKFLFIILVFYLCWIPNIINGILLWTLWFNLPKKVIIALWYIMAVMNPLQAFLNSIVYRRWSGGGDHIYLPFGKRHKSEPSISEEESILNCSSNTEPDSPGEETPLLRSHEYSSHNAGTSINGSGVS